MVTAAGAAFAGFLLLVLLVVATDGASTWLDGDLTPSLWAWASQDAGRWSAMRVLTRGGEAIFRTLVIAPLVIVGLLRRRVAVATWAGLCGFSYGLVSSAAKAIIGRPRPVGADPELTFQESSFPSGHSGGAMVVAIIVACAVGMSLRGVARVAVIVLSSALPIVVGFTRMALGVHYLSDVLAGFALAFAWAMLLAVVVRQAAGRLCGAAPPVVRKE